MRVNGYLMVTAILFAIVAGAHVLRLGSGWPVTVATWTAPAAVSWVGAIAALALCLWAILLLRRHR